MKILLISPGTPDEIDNRIIRQIPYLNAIANTAPHAVASVAALTPAHHHVVIHDEYIHGPSEHFLPGKSFDIIGISVTSNMLKRSLQIAEHCRKYCPQAIIVVGGIGVETLIYKNKENIDVVFHGEAEDTWPKFLKDVENGHYDKVYKSILKPDMTKVPAPRWELLGKDIHKYNSVSIQTTRGCPYDCSFCDVIYTYGRKPRSKTISQVIHEIKKLHELNVSIAFIADDNFAGNRKYAKELLREIIRLNSTFKVPMGFFTQIDITIANDDELLQLLADANFTVLMIGIESANPESLKQMDKKQNLALDIDNAVRKIQSYGMVILAHMIIGTDADDDNVFRHTADFIQRNNIVFHICHPLAAPPGTKMWYQYKREGRLVTTEHLDACDKIDIITNIIPKKLSRIELLEGLANYWNEIYQHDKFAERAIGFLKNITYTPKVKHHSIHSFWKMRSTFGKAIIYFLFKADKKHRKTFFKIASTFKTKLGTLMQKIIFIYTFYLIDCLRSEYDATMAREIADYEKKHPEQIKPDDCIIPLTENIRAYADEIINEAYKLLRNKAPDKETLYNMVLETLTTFNDRFGNHFDTFDDVYKQHLHTTCESIINKWDEKITSFTTTSHFTEKPPYGFTREITDLLDNAIRYKNIYG